MNRQEHRVTIFPEKDHFSRCFAVVSEMGRHLGFDHEQEFRFAVCVSEAYTNAFVHGNKQDPTKSIELVFSWDDVSVRVDVEDQGDARSQDVRLDDSRPDVDSEKTGGRGVGIMKLFADKMEVEERLEGGLRVSITFLLRESRAASDVLLQNSNGGFHGNQSH